MATSLELLDSLLSENDYGKESSLRKRTAFTPEETEASRNSEMLADQGGIGPSLEDELSRAKSSAQRQALQEEIARRGNPTGQEDDIFGELMSIASAKAEVKKPEKKPGFLETVSDAVGWKKGLDFKRPEGVTDDTFSAGIPESQRQAKSPNALPGSVMDGYSEDKPLIERRGAPVRKEVRESIQREYEASPKKRKSLVGRDDWVGSVAQTVDESYMQQPDSDLTNKFDRRLENRQSRIAASEEASPEVAYNMARQSARGGVLPGLESTGRIDKSEFDSSWGDGGSLGLVGDFAAGEVGATGASLADIGRRTGVQSLQSLGDAMTNWAEKKQPANPTFADDLVNGLGSMASFFVPGLGVTKGAKALSALSPALAKWAGAGAMAGLEAAAESDGVYKELIKQGLTEQEASKRADAVFAANLALLGVTDKLGFFNDIRIAYERGGKRMALDIAAKVGSAKATEGTQEYGQQVIQNVATGKQETEGAAYAGLLGSIIGGGASAAGVVATTPFSREARLAQAIEDDSNAYYMNGQYVPKMGQDQPEKPKVSDILSTSSVDEAIAATNAALDSHSNDVAQELESIKQQQAAQINQDALLNNVIQVTGAEPTIDPVPTTDEILRPKTIAGQASDSYTDEQLQAISSDVSAHADTRKSAALELQARSNQATQLQNTVIPAQNISIGGLTNETSQATQAAVPELGQTVRQDNGSYEQAAAQDFQSRPGVPSAVEVRRLFKAQVPGLKYVTPDSLPDSQKGTEINGLRRREAKFLQDFFKANGLQVHFVDIPKGKGFAGAFVRQFPGHIFVNTNSSITISMRGIVGHESLHNLRVTSPQLYNLLVENLQKLGAAKLSQAEFQPLYSPSKDAKSQLQSQDHATEEQIANLWGNVLHDPKQFQQLLDNIYGPDVKGAAKFVAKIRSYIADLVANLKQMGRGYDTTKYQGDLKKVQKELIAAFTAYAKANGVGAMQAELQVAKASTEAKQQPAQQQQSKNRRVVDPSADNAMVAIAKLGGMDTDALLQNGFDENDISVRSGARVSKKTGELSKAPLRPRQVGFNLPIHRRGGMSFDGMREMLVQYGYLPEDASVNEAIDLFRRSLTENIYTASANERMAQEAEAARAAEMAASETADQQIGVSEESPRMQNAVDGVADAIDNDREAFVRGIMSAGFTREEANAIYEETVTAGKGTSSTTYVGAQESGRVGDQEVQADEGIAGEEKGRYDDLDIPFSPEDSFALEQQTNGTTKPKESDLTKEQIDRERDGVPFSLQQESQPKPVGVQGTLFSPEGSASRSLVNAWQEIASNEKAFSYPKTDSKDFGSIMREYLPNALVQKQDVDPAEYVQAWKIYPNKDDLSKVGYMIHYVDGRVENNLLNFGEGNDGSAVYAASGAYAYNNGLVMAVDRLDISRQGIIRRIESMLSLALKYGTTDFMLPNEKLGLDWKYGDDEHNIEQLLKKSYTNTKRTYPWIADYTYDFKSGDFRKKSGRGTVYEGTGEQDESASQSRARNLSSGAENGQRESAADRSSGLGGNSSGTQRGLEGVQSIAGSDQGIGDSGAAPSGRLNRTVKRAIITDALLRELRGEDGARVFAALRQVGNKDRVLYSPESDVVPKGEDAPTFNDLSDDQRDAVRKAIDRAIAIEQGNEAPPVRKESALLKLRSLRKRHEQGKIGDQYFIAAVNSLQANLEEASAAKKYAPVKERERGADYIRERLLQAKRRGEISEEVSDMTEWFVQKNPSLVNDLGISIRAASREEEGSRGRYMPASRVVRLFKENAADTTGIHEILHHLERMMPEEFRTAIRKEYDKTILGLRKNANAETVAYLDKALEANIGNAKAQAEAIKMIQDGKVPYGLYQFLNTSEFWAVNGADLMSKRYASKDSMFGRIKQWMSEFVEKIKNVLGLRSNAPIIKAMDKIIAGDGEYVSKDMLSMSSKFFDPVKAWHGSPHDHNKFDSSKIGTGEGAQAYGYGHYFADRRELAEWYRDTFQKNLDKGFFKPNYIISKDALDNSKWTIDRYKTNSDINGDPVENYSMRIDGKEFNSHQEAIDYLFSNYAEKSSYSVKEDDGFFSVEPRAKLYQVTLPEESTFLLWDKPLSEQTDEIKFAIANAGVYTDRDDLYDFSRTTLGKDIYRHISYDAGGDKKASEVLKSVGISGIKYLDGQSRDAGEGNFNYVVFDDNDIQIDAKFSPEPVEIDDPHAAFWSKIKSGESFTTKELDNAYSIGRRGTVRTGRVVATPLSKGIDSTLAATTPAKWEGSVAGIDGGYFTTGHTRQFQGKPQLILSVTPAKFAVGINLGSFSDVSDRSITQVAFTWMEGDTYRMDIRGVAEDSYAFKELSKDKRIDDRKAGYFAPILDNPKTETRAFIQEGVRRLALFHGDVPSVVQMGRDTGSRAGSRDARFFDKDVVEAKFSPANGFELPKFTTADKFQERIQDRYNRFRDVLKSVREQGGTVNDLNDFSMGEDRFHGVAMERVIGIQERLQVILEEAKAKDITMDEITMFAYAEHAPSRNAAMQKINPQVKTGSGMSNQEAADIIDAADKEGKKDDLESLTKKLRSIAQDTLALQVSSGLTTQEEADAYRNKYGDKWVPLRGFETIDADGRTFRGTGVGFNIRGKENLRALGRDSKAGQIIENILLDAERTAIRATKNTEVNHRLLQFVMDNPDANLWEIDATKTRRSLKGEKVKDDLVIDKGDNTIGVKVKGQMVYVKIYDQKLFEQMANQWEGIEWKGIPYLADFSRYLSKSYTAWSPEFALYTNPVRDIQAALFSITGREGVGMAAKFVKAYPKALNMAYKSEVLGKDDPLYAEYKALGGKTGFWNHNTLETKVKEIEALVKDMESKPIKNPIRYSFRMLKLLESLVSNHAGALENATRFASYVAMRDAGRSREEAAAFAKNLNVNFNRRGTWTAGIGSIVLFFNPAIQGIHNQYQTLVHGKHKGQAWALMAAQAGAMAAMAMLNAGAGEDDDGIKWWDKIADYEKERNFIIVIPPYMKNIGEQIKDSTGRYIKIPMPYQWNIGAYFGTLMADVSRNEENPAEGTSLGKASLLLSKAVATSYNPVGIPSFVAPALQHNANKKPFGEGQLYPESQFNAHKPDSEKYTAKQKGTAWQEWAAFVNEATGGNQFKEGLISVPPAVWKNYVRTYLGGPVSFLEGIYDAKAEEDITKAPFLRKMYGEVGFNADEGKFYRDTEKPIATYKAFKDAAKADPEYAEQMMKTEGVMIELGNTALNYKNAIGKITKDDIAIKDRTDLSDGAKRVKLKLNEKKRSDLQEEYLKEQRQVLGNAALQ